MRLLPLHGRDKKDLGQHGLLWTIAIVLDDDVPTSALDDPFDSRLFVPRNQDEVVSVVDDARTRLAGRR